MVDFVCDTNDVWTFLRPISGIRFLTVRRIAVDFGYLVTSRRGPNDSPPGSLFKFYQSHRRVSNGQLVLVFAGDGKTKFFTVPTSSSSPPGLIYHRRNVRRIGMSGPRRTARIFACFNMRRTLLGRRLSRNSALLSLPQLSSSNASTSFTAAACMHVRIETYFIRKTFHYLISV